MRNLWRGLLTGALLITQTVALYAQSIDDTGNGITLPNVDINSIANRVTQGAGAENRLPETQTTILRPNLPYYYPAQQSELEDYYSRRAGTNLEQFGYDSFGRPATVTARQMGALQDTYILGVGDNLSVSLIGQQNNVLNAAIDRDGNVQLPKLPPIAAAGRRLGDVRTEIEARVRTAYLATQVYVSVGAVRQVSVLVSGEVLAPGAVSVSALNSPIDAILLAGGVKKTGSLRQVKIIRGDKTIPIDLYAALTSSSSSKLTTSLAEGDKIIVPPINETAAIAGDVPRPGIFEMAPSASSISVESLLTLGGRFSRGGTPRLSILRVASDGTQVLEPVKGLSGVLHRGDILFVAPQSAPEHGRVALSGQVRNPGTFDLSRAPTLRTLLGSPNVYEEQPYMVFAAISRRDPQTLARVIVPFAPAQVLQGTFDLPLQDDDIVRVFSVAEVRVLAAQLRAEDDARNPAIRDLRTSQSGAGAGQSRGGTVGAALAGQNNQGLSGGGTASAGAGATPQSGTSVSGLAGVPAQTNVLPQQPSGAYVPNQPSGVGALAYGANQPYGGAYPQGQAQQQGQNVQPMGTYSSQAYPFGYQYQAPGYQGYPPPAYYQGYPQYPAFQQPGYPYPPFQGAPYMRGGGPADAVQGLPMYKAQRPAYDPKLQPFSRNNLVFDLSDPSIRSQLANYRVSLLGAVHVTGDYLAAPGVGLDSLVEAAGGLTITADLTSIEVTSTIYDQQTGQANTTRTSFSAAPSQLGKIVLHSRDAIRFRDVYSDRDAGQVVLRGQVRFPGSFDILRGERLSSLLARAGGLTDISYPAGAVFTRESAARAEEDGYRRAAEELEREFTVLVSSSDQATSVSPQGVQFIRETIERLQTAQGVGRISVDADPVSIAAHPSRDMVLEPGDFLFVPRRPNSVSVTGEVLSAGSYLYSGGASAGHYIRLAGGYALGADRKRTFVLMPDGTAQPLQQSLLAFSGAQIVPGATIIVPRDLEPFRLRRFILDLSQIFSQLAVSAASIAVIQKG